MPLRPTAPVTVQAETPAEPEPAEASPQEPVPVDAEASAEQEQEPAPEAEPTEPEPVPEETAAPPREPDPVAISDPPLPRTKPVQLPAVGGDDSLATSAPAFAGAPVEGLDLVPDVMGPMLEDDPLAGEPGPRPDYLLDLAATLTEEGEPLPSGVVWRVFRAQPAIDGSFELVDESTDPQPAFLLPADDYIVHVAYGRADTATRVSLREGPVSEEIALDAGGLRLTCIDAMSDDLSDAELVLSVYSSEQDEYGQRRLIVEEATPGHILRLNPGTYHIVSRWGDANAVVRADVLVKPGELTDATISHRAAVVTLKLVNEPGGEALANTNWSILSPGGDVVKESFGAFPTHVLAAGEYSIIARHEGSLYNREFQVTPGLDGEVELVAQ